MKIDETLKSWSEIVDELQGDREKGRALLIKMAEAIQNNTKVVENLELQLHKAQGTVSAQKTAVFNIIKHLEVKNPVVIVQGNKVYMIDYENCIDIKEGNL